MHHLKSWLPFNVLAHAQTMLSLTLTHSLVFLQQIESVNNLKEPEFRNRKGNAWIPGRFSDTVASRIVSPTAWIKAGPPVTAPSFWLVTSTTMPLLLPSSIVGYHFSKTWSPYSKASALLCKPIQITIVIFLKTNFGEFELNCNTFPPLKRRSIKPLD